VNAEHLDVLIIGAGISGIGAACHLRDQCSDKTFAVLESRDAIGGTWDLFRYPGIRSDSDMFTLGYSFRPWPHAKSIAEGSTIRDYLRDTADEYRIADAIRLRHKAIRAEWSTVDGRWTVDVLRVDTGEAMRITCRFLLSCSGYYRYDQGYTPEFPGIERFAGQVVHPQHWPDDLDYTGKRVVVIGSGATAVTLVPAMAEQAEHVTMLQRSPSYIAPIPARDRLADRLRATLPPHLAARVVRWKNVLTTMVFYQLSRRKPELIKRLIRRIQRPLLPADYDYRHLAPSYLPWDQRMCLVPDGDLFTAIRHGKASIATDRIDTFTEHSIRLASGVELPADIVVTATGLNLLMFGGLSISVDGTEIDPAETVSYKGMMLSGIPNFVFALGYTNASWTLKIDLVHEYVCRLLRHMDQHGYQRCMPTPPADGDTLEPFIGLQSGYILRSADMLPKQGPHTPWRLYQNYVRDVLLLRYGSLEDEAMWFSRTPARVLS
jgi:cation diffusion facilitator CzcD-associated flavoprotein CzcO